MLRGHAGHNSFRFLLRLLWAQSLTGPIVETFNRKQEGDQLMRDICRVLGMATVALGLSPSLAQASELEPRSFSVNFEQKFKLTTCPAEAPAGFTCLDVTGNAKSMALGTLTFERTVLFDLRKFDKLHPTCIPDETSGTLVLPGGILNFRAPGSVCLADGTASYGLIVTGGTGAYRGAAGGGRITVPPQTGPGNGRELWQVELYE
jgi:hypothetical protein